METYRDRAQKDSFSASNPPANSGTPGAEKPDKPSHQRGIEEQPTGMPTSDRHATETAHQWEHEEKPKPKP
ncbi:hypothetical protein [Rhodopila sp.]|uniref:hypothetical protein n=1 Tax=Rhodopila sp. TaxID=2480087 RepID=UPI003D0E77A9